MKLLVRPAPFDDEALESYLLRLSDANGFESYQSFIFVIGQWLKENDHEAAGALPTKLSLSNIYHAGCSSSFRVRAYKLIETLTGLQRLPLLRLALMHSETRFGDNRASVFRDSVDIPLCFLRADGVPVCPTCLSEENYIRQRWHFIPYLACHRHGCKLHTHCQDCGSIIDYQKVENINRCSCGFDLRYGNSEDAHESHLRLSRELFSADGDLSNALQATNNISTRFGALLWFYFAIHKGSSDQISQDPDVLAEALSFFDEWPIQLHEKLDLVVEESHDKLTRNYNQTSFSIIFGRLLIECQKLPMRDIGRNFILKTIVDYLEVLVERNPRSKHSNVADILLSLNECAALLSTSFEQVYRLYEEGALPIARKPKSGIKLQPSAPFFHLRNVIELKLAHMQSQKDYTQIFTPAW